ncbi:hypothetical protein G8C93_06395 [Cellulosimicrobium cellulans]|uniref:restriction endonuclease subunit S n=1 Tax=Cellulosimicrobium cellulans TaxID=1710 RepID=UPI00188416A0|nr:restriction endonuclease subunit S [Cellulosimicrobium cellulans]MBE9925519.1 hypothetical protein [Cellulosimicrobium cellulans]
MTATPEQAFLPHAPEGWVVSRFGRAITINEGQVDPRVEPWASTVLIAPNHIESGSGRILDLETASEQGADSGKYLAAKGQVLYSKIRPALNKVAIAPADCLCSADMYAIEPGDEVDTRFLAYFMRARPFHAYVSITADRVKMPKVNREELSAAPWMRPSLDEQRAIADFLDEQTSRIDTLIGKQTHLIDTLRERRDALWSHGFADAESAAPSVPLRRLVTSIVDGPFGSSLTSAHYTDGGVRVIRLGNIGINEFKDADRAYISTEYGTELSGHDAREGDVVIAGLGDERMPLGRAAVVPKIGPAIVKADCYRVRPAPRVLGAYLAWALSAPPARAQMRSLARGSTRQRLNTAVVRDVVLPLPSIGDQAEVLRRFEMAVSKVDAVIARTEEHIALARERRAALITAAVTGQIDVRTAGRIATVGA